EARLERGCRTPQGLPRDSGGPTPRERPATALRSTAHLPLGAARSEPGRVPPAARRAGTPAAGPPPPCGRPGGGRPGPAPVGPLPHGRVHAPRPVVPSSAGLPTPGVVAGASP